MIAIKKITINEAQDYEKLLDKEVISEDYIDSGIVKMLKEYVGNRCKVIDVEYPYYDNDYLSSYYVLYSKKHKSYSKKCYRLLFFSDTRCSNLIGYITLRPTYNGTHVCKTIFEPYEFLTENANLILSKEKVHYMGGEAVLDSFPQMGQEGSVSACAHVSLWSILRSFPNRFQNFGAYRIADIANKSIHFERKNIPTNGLTINQISNIFKQVGFSPIVERRENDDFDDEIMSYLESGIPLVGVITNRNHAVALIGVCDKMDAEIPDSYINKVSIDTCDEYQIIMNSKFIPGVYVNDDNSFPYGVVKKYVQTGTEIKNNRAEFSLRDIDYIIVPLHHRVYMAYREMRAFFFGFFEKNAYRLNWANKLVARMFLVSSNRYKEYIYSIGQSINPNIRETILALETPKFMWCIEISQPDNNSKNIVDHIMLIDSTATIIEDDPVLFLSGKEFIEYRDGETFKRYDIDLHDGLGIKSFDNLLEKVNYKHEQD